MTEPRIPPPSAERAATGTLALLVVRGPNAGARFLVDDAGARIGRHPTDTIFLDDITVSRHHAELIEGGGSWNVRDLGSLNGTYLNGRRVEEAAIRDSDALQIGKFVFHCRIRGDV